MIINGIGDMMKTVWEIFDNNLDLIDKTTLLTCDVNIFGTKSVKLNIISPIKI